MSATEKGSELLDRRGSSTPARARHLNRFHEGVLVAQEVIHLDTTQTKLNGDLQSSGTQEEVQH